MDDTTRKQIAKLFSDTDLIFIPEPEYEEEDWNTEVKRHDDDVKKYASTTIDIATAEFYVEEGSADMDFWEHADILENTGVQFCVEDQYWIEIYEPVASFINACADKGVKIYTPDTFNKYLKSQNIPYTFEDFLWTNNQNNSSQSRE